MKKRIGTKLYDTGTAEQVLVSEFGTLYRKRTRDREWFLVNGETILPMSDKEARAFLGENVYQEKLPDSDTIMVRVDRGTHAVIASMAKTDGVSITEEIRRIVAELYKKP